jgi:aryl-alcohol dehydrogenase-like predicted oxidoreductase
VAASWDKVTLGRTGLRVTPLGIASSFGVKEQDVERAFERGVDYFYWGSSRRGSFGRGVRHLAAKHRERMTIVVQSYTRAGFLMQPSLEIALRRLGTEYTDLLLLGWWNAMPPERILDAAQALVEKGRARHLMISCHHRPSFAVLQRRFAAIMVRYNAAHPGAEQEVFPLLQHPKPGVVAYTATRWGQLPRKDLTPPGEETPRGSDCYRFALTNPSVDVVLCGPKDGAELDEALAALDRGPMSPEELAWMKRVGSAVKSRSAGPNLATAAGLADRLMGTRQ